MFGFFRRKPAPPPCKSNPGIGVKADIGFSNGDRNWTEKIDLICLAEAAFKKQNHSVVNQKTWLLHPTSGFLILPQLVALQPLDDGGVQTVTTLQINHPVLVPNGVFEYQHATGNTSAEAIAQGFDQWLQTDFVTLLEALKPEPESCTVLKMSFPAKDGQPARSRRVVLGPVTHFMENRQNPGEANVAEDHPFCPCCLFTRSFAAFKEFAEGDGFHGIRLFAARDAEGIPQADCRVNGEDWAKGILSLCDYAKTWPAAGYEFRKQYVVLQTIETTE